MAAFGRVYLQEILGVSFGNFPRPVSDIIAAGLPWTIGSLEYVAILISWVSAYSWARWPVTFMTGVGRNSSNASSSWSIPFHILLSPLSFIFVFAWWLKWFPLMGGSRGEPGLTWEYISTLLYFGFLPALSLVIGSTAFRFIMAKSLTTTEIASDYVQYAELAAVPKRKIILFYVARNTMLPQVTDLALAFGAMFEGALITEVLFAYPGLGFVLYNAIYNADYNIIMGIALLSIVGIATAMLIIDLLYPVLDPRVRLR